MNSWLDNELVAVLMEAALRGALKNLEQVEATTVASEGSLRGRNILANTLEQKESCHYCSDK